LKRKNPFLQQLWSTHDAQLVLFQYFSPIPVVVIKDFMD